MSMTLEQLELEVKRLQEQMAAGRRAQDILEIWKLQSLYSHLYHIGKRSAIPPLFAQKTPGVILEIEDGGVYEGIESVNIFWNTVLSDKGHLVPGFLSVHMTVNPVIELNKEGTRAKGLWHSHGYASLMRNSQLTPFLMLGKYDMEYVKEDEQWKFLKFIYRLTFNTPLNIGWVEEPVAFSLAGSPDNHPDRPATCYRPYSRDRLNILQPPPPEPYAD